LSEYGYLAIDLLTKSQIGLLASISLSNHPELFRLLEPGETIEDLLKLSPEQILLRWFNFHLKAANHSKRVKNFGGDIKDSEAYTVLLHQLSPGW
jgi:plastin-1